jgi:hypothetical protein
MKPASQVTEIRYDCVVSRSILKYLMTHSLACWALFLQLGKYWCFFVGPLQEHPAKHTCALALFAASAHRHTPRLSITGGAQTLHTRRPTFGSFGLSNSQRERRREPQGQSGVFLVGLGRGFGFFVITRLLHA